MRAEVTLTLLKPGNSNPLFETVHSVLPKRGLVGTKTSETFLNCYKVLNRGVAGTLVSQIVLPLWIRVKQVEQLIPVLVNLLHGGEPVHTSLDFAVKDCDRSSLVLRQVPYPVEQVHLLWVGVVSWVRFVGVRGRRNFTRFSRASVCVLVRP